jgi:hypothetical protein
LQIADFLVNGAGFCRRLGEDDGDGPLVGRLVSSMLDDDADPLVARYFNTNHTTTCSRACYRCLQRYNNRGFHGLLDWRLGLGFLRAMKNGAWRAGLDDGWTATRETVDWPTLAALAAEDLRRLDPQNRQIRPMGPLRLPTVFVRRGAGQEAFVVVHPFWRLDAAARASTILSQTIADTRVRDVYFIDTFEIARRPVRAVENARNRPRDRF